MYTSLELLFGTYDISYYYFQHVLVWASNCYCKPYESNLNLTLDFVRLNRRVLYICILFFFSNLQPFVKVPSWFCFMIKLSTALYPSELKHCTSIWNWPSISMLPKSLKGKYLDFNDKLNCRIEITTDCILYTITGPLRI